MRNEIQFYICCSCFCVSSERRQMFRWTGSIGSLSSGSAMRTSQRRARMYMKHGLLDNWDTRLEKKVIACTFLLHALNEQPLSYLLQPRGTCWDAVGNLIPSPCPTGLQCVIRLKLGRQIAPVCQLQNTKVSRYYYTLVEAPIHEALSERERL